ncbi:MAG TPA: M3 family oligoendopeptidase [Candidatus Binatia bacterium]|jgi:oligoendopeptidase F|nr:M3 family oligoendopeptidase [Candidatus Binatia bacterium]
MPTGLPSSPDALRDGDWGRIAPLYEELAARPLDGIGTWLRDWSELEALVEEASELAGIAYTTDTSDAEKERLHLIWSGELAPRLHEQRVRLARRLVESGYEEPGMEVPIRRLRNQIALYREENLPLQGDLARLRSRYAKVTGQMQVEWDGERLTVPQVQAKLGEADRDVRERAYRLHLRPYVEARDELGTIFDEMVELRQRVAHNAGFANYRDFAHQEKDRFDYTPDDCLRWHDAVEEVAVPAATRALERRRLGMGLDRLRPWDVEGSPDPLGRPALRPFRDARELVETAGGVFEQVDPALGERFRTMAGEGLLDLDSRLGKAAGGYCVALSHRRRPFIFMNATGTQKDVDTLLHESGHSFHVFECAAAQPLHWQQQYGAEIAEVASMSMELLCAPHLAASEGGFYASEEDATRARAENLERILLFFGHCASVDAFQHWIYTDPGGTDRAARDRRWLELRARFEPGIDHSGLETERVARWHRQLHFFEVPFYYIEYGLAQLGALQVWRESRRDRPAALAAYRRALALGGTRPLPELYAAAGARLLFDREGIRELIELVESELDTLAG